MAACLGSVVQLLVSFWKPNIRIIRQFLPFFFFGVSLTGSILKELDVVPQTYFSSSRNLLNLYFVKISWGWNLVLLLPFLFLSNSYNRTHIYVLKRLTALVVATAIWYICTETFFYIEDITGTCYGQSESVQVVREEFSTKAECRRAGLMWDGFDISGHSFILAYSTFLIVEEMVPMLHLVQHNQKRTAVLDALYVALNAIVVIWVWMFACTSVYFHETIHKILGTGCAVLGWYLTYKAWYLNPFSPGLPPHHSDHKQHE
ncbi:acyl-coenzyme A diphosphatase FITM2 [Astyanax mexicanus]|uniref:acyl-coenzyme A diphosphatase FITM2 n=1 Tax=Astyanax mexicanus TaxID=7994 RepID=UPI0020CB4EEB|nr:acyl-coenzyme A diphosphatase FITM2 [Astyanax mexicanus]